jgi:hypothetical protein
MNLNSWNSNSDISSYYYIIIYYISSVFSLSQTNNSSTDLTHIPAVHFGGSSNSYISKALISLLINSNNSNFSINIFFAFIIFGSLGSQGSFNHRSHVNTADPFIYNY